MTTPTREPTKLTARQQAILEYVRTHQPVSLAQIAQRFGCSTSTASVHMMTLRAEKLVWPSSRGRTSRWSADQPFAEPRMPPAIKPVPIEQVSSIWHWAQRHARTA